MPAGVCRHLTNQSEVDGSIKNLVERELGNCFKVVDGLQLEI